MRDPKGPQTIGWTRRRGSDLHPVSSDTNLEKQRRLIVWSVLFAAAALMVIVGFSIFWVRAHRGSPAVAEPETHVRVVSRFPSPSEDEALALVKQALAIRDPAMVEGIMRTGDVKPAEVVEFMTGMDARDGPIKQMSWLSSMDVDGQLLEGVLVICAGESAVVQRLAFLVPDEDGVWRMDFEAFARTSNPSWKDFIRGRAGRARVRVLLARDSYFNGPFSDEDHWDCYALTAPEVKDLLPDGQMLLRGYCRKDSPQARALERICKENSKAERAILEIVRTAGAGPRQFEISRVLAEEWVLPAEPFDEKFD